MPAASGLTAISPAELSYLHTSLCHDPPIRPDARSATDFRPFRAETDVLPTCNGSSHLSLADGSQALVGVKADTQRTAGADLTERRLEEEMAAKMKLNVPGVQTEEKDPSRGDARWIHLNVDISTVRDDDPLLVFLGETLREPLLAGSSTSGSDRSLADALVINRKWHWELNIDVLLLSPLTPASGATTTGYPLPLLSLAIHLALRSTRLPKLKSQGEEDPSVDDDWEESKYLFPRRDMKETSVKDKPATTPSPIPESIPTPTMPTPPITLLVMTAGPNILFDPSTPELAVADSILAISIILSHDPCQQQQHPKNTTSPTSNPPKTTTTTTTTTILSMRTLDTPARNTMKGVPASETASSETDPAPGLWRPKVGGVKREMVKRVVRAVVGGGDGDGVAGEVFEALEAFVSS